MAAVHRIFAATFLALLALLSSLEYASAQRGGEVTVTISPPPEIKAEPPFYTASGEHRLHFNNTTSRDGKILSIELLFIEQTERSKSCDLFFGNMIGAAVRRYDLKNLAVPSAKMVNATAKLLPPEQDGNYAPEAGENIRDPRVIIIACYKFVFELDDAELEVTQLAGRWTFDRKTGKLLQKSVAPKAELLPR